MDAAAQLAVESLKLALEQLKKSWGAYQSNYTDAEAVFEYAQRVLRIMDHWAGANGPVELKNLLEKIDVIKVTVKHVREEVEMANTLGGKLHRFLLADSTKSKLHALETGLKQLLSNLEDDLRLKKVLNEEFVGQVLLTIKNPSAREFWATSAGQQEWSMPFTKFVEFYSSKAPRANDVKTVAPLATNVSRNDQGNQVEEEEDVACRCGPTWRHVLSSITGCNRPKKAAAGAGSDATPKVEGSKDDPTAEEGRPLLGSVDQIREEAEASPYTTLTKQDRKALVYALCGNQDEAPVKLVEKDEVVTVSLLNSFVESYGFPFDPVALPEPPQIPVVVFSTTERLKIADMCMGLQEAFSRPETGESITLILESVNERAKAIKEALGGPGDTDEAREMRSRYKLLRPPPGAPGAKLYEERQLRCFAADWLTSETASDGFKKLDQARRAWSHLLQRYMTMWRLGNLTQEMFEEIDFPGTNRIITFLSYCEPLDEANFRIKIKRCKGAVDKLAAEESKELSRSWDGARPKIYSFFRLLLRWKDELDKKADAAAKLNVGDAGTGSPGTPSKPTRESKAPQPVQFGGIVPPPEAPQHIPLTNVLPDGAPEAQILKDSTNNLEDVELVQDKPIQM